MKIRKIKFTAMLSAKLFVMAAFVWLAPAARAQILKPGEIIYSRVNTGGNGANCSTSAVWVVGQDGSNDRFITNGLRPRISPDGRSIMFQRYSANTSCFPGNGAPQWWMRELATGRETQIAQSVGASLGHFFSPETNRSDRQLLFDDATSLCTMKLDGTNKVCLSGSFGQLAPIRYAAHPTVRGTDYLIVVANYDGNTQPDGGLYTLSYSDFSNRIKIPNTNFADLNPSWSNDGQTIAYGVTNPSNRGIVGPFVNLFTIKPDGSNKTQLTFLNPPAGEGFYYGLVWTHDNSTIINAAKINGVPGIYKISASGGGILGRIPITAGNAPEWVGGIVPVYSEQQTASFGGGLTSGGSYSLVDTIGQAFAGQTSTGGSYNLQSGFWTNLPSVRAPFDFDGDSKTDIGIFRPAPAEWWYLRSSDGSNRAVQFGQTSDQIAPADFTGDGKTDIAFWRESSGQWFIIRSEDSSFYAYPFGSDGDIPAPGDFDGDGKADTAVFRPSNATWYILRSSDNQVSIIQFGIAEDQPVVADYDGDGKADIAIFRPSVSEWWTLRSTAGLRAVQFGQSGDKTVQGDYTGDGKADIAFWRPSTGFWYILRSEDSSFFAYPFGSNGDIPTPGDYDGDGKMDAAVFRPSNSTWYLQRSTSGFLAIGFGINGDQPIPNAFVR